MFNLQGLPPIERKPDGSLIRMTPEQKRKANALIRKECCNDDGGNCLLLDDGEKHVCPQSISHSVCCKFFRYILLESKAGQTLKAVLFRRDALRKCILCGTNFSSASNNAKYCGDCAKTALRKQKAAYARKRRGRVEKLRSKNP